jgi:L-asparagine transporter-like permease
MNKEKLIKLLSIALMIISFALVLVEYTNNSEFRILSIASYLALFLFGAYYFYLNKKNERKRKEESVKDQ